MAVTHLYLFGSTRHSASTNTPGWSNGSSASTLSDHWRQSRALTDLGTASDRACTYSGMPKLNHAFDVSRDR